MSLFDAFFYGFIQGITEFFPISSSGHLVLLPHLLNLKDPGVAFDLFMHLGTALAVLIYFKKEISSLFQALVNFFLRKDHPSMPLLKNFFFSTLATLAVILLIQGWAQDYGRLLQVVAFNFIFFGVLMFVADHFLPTSFKLERRHACFIGLAQALAIFPGVSRSGITLTMARFLKISRQESTRYSFLLSLPLIFAGILKEIVEIFFSSQKAPLVDFTMAFFAIGVSFGIGILSIHFFLKLIQRWGLGFFALYRIALGGCIFIFLA